MEKYSLRNQLSQTSNDERFKDEISQHFLKSSGTLLDKLNNFSRYVPRQSLSLFLAKNELFKQIINIHGCIVECGVFMGGGLFTWAQLSSIYEPINHNRKIIGFDTFSGFPTLTNKDLSASDTEQEYKRSGAYNFEADDELLFCAELHNINRPLGHIPNIELIKGDAINTIPNHLEKNSHIVVSLLYLDFDLYEPTKLALELFIPRMPKGGVLVFDELNQKQWPGETLAVLETVGINNIKIQRFSFTPSLSYAVIE